VPARAGSWLTPDAFIGEIIAEKVCSGRLNRYTLLAKSFTDFAVAASTMDSAGQKQTGKRMPVELQNPVLLQGLG
jgi:hypothetical protein